MITKSDLCDALRKLYPQVVTIVDDAAYDQNGVEVTYDAAAVQAEAEANEYKSLRAFEYPSFADQLDTIFHDGLEAWKEQIQAVKDKYPKA